MLNQVQAVERLPALDSNQSYKKCKLHAMYVIVTSQKEKKRKEKKRKHQAENEYFFAVTHTGDMLPYICIKYSL